MPERLPARPFELLDSVLRVIGTAVSVRRLERRHGLDELVRLLRAADPAAAPSRRRAALEAQVVARLLPLLPPWGMGLCIKRSLLQLALWSRRGIAARLCLGTGCLEGGRREGHAWLEVDEPELAPLAGRPAGDPVVVL